MNPNTSHRALHSIKVGNIQFRLEGNLGSLRAELTCEEAETDLHFIHLELTSPVPITPEPLKLVWHYPIIDVQAMWYPGCNAKRWFTMSWDTTVQSQATKEAPVISLYNLTAENRLTFACSDVLNRIESTASIDEANSTFACRLDFFAHPTAPLCIYRATLRLDQRVMPYYQSLNDVQAWWASQPENKPSLVPEAGRLPMYSTWYSFHQELTDAEVEKQSRWARDFGCEAVIIDDGWQTEDNNRGYAYCGDWEVCHSKIPDMAAHVARLHQMGMKSLLWFSVPFIGFKSRAYERFKGKYLYEIESMQAAVLDPRYPEAREYLIELYETAIREWDFDGLKLDFVDQFTPTLANYQDDPKGRDIASVPEAVDRLLSETMERLSRLKPDILIEFRQAYIGPLMRKYGNLFRAGDCPNDAICNRARTIDVRLLAGSTATHSDMLMWSSEEPVESAALQMLNILFSVPQISVKFDQIPEDHRRMLQFWLRFWIDHRDVLLDGLLEPYHPELQYPFILAKTTRQWIGALYADMVAGLSGPIPRELYLINATQQPRVVLEVSVDSGFYQIEERSVLGEIVDQRTTHFSVGLHAVPVGRSGLLHFTRVSNT